MTNAGFLLPEPGFHEALRRLTREAGTLLAIDETHTLVCAYGGLAREWELEPDFLTVGKSIAAGVPLAAYGMTDEIAALIAPPEEARRRARGQWSTRSPPAARCSRTRCRWPPGAPRCSRSSPRRRSSARPRSASGWPTGLRTAIERGRSAVERGRSTAPTPTTSSRPTPPIDGAGSRAADDPDLRALIRVFMANRGVWESGWWLGPTVSVAHGRRRRPLRRAVRRRSSTEVT